MLEFITCIESALGMQAKKNWLPMQPGDVPMTCASNDALRDWVGYVPGTRIDKGVDEFVAWYLDYHQHRVARSEHRATDTLGPIMTAQPI